MKKAFFAYQYGMTNAGDFAVNMGSLDLLEDFFDKITIMSKQTNDETDYKDNVEYLKKYYPGFDIIDGPFNLNRGNVIETFKSYLLGLVRYPLLLLNSKYKEEIKKSDIVFLNGNNILRCESITDYIRLYALMFPLKLAKNNNKDYILLPLSTTEINSFGKRKLNVFLNNAKLIFARETITYDKLTSIFPSANVLHSLDVAFFIKDRKELKIDYQEKYGFLAYKERNICITIRKESIGDIGELNDNKRIKIEENITVLTKKLLKNNYYITFVVQTKKDKNFTKKICSKFGYDAKVRLIEEYDPLMLREIYRNAICLFGMRLHSMILSMSVGTPVVGYFDSEWGSKNPGTLEKFNMPFSYLDEKTELYSLFKDALNNKKIMISKIEEAKKDVVNLLKKEV